MDDPDWSYIRPNIKGFSGNKFQHSIVLEDLVLDLQVVSADLRNSQNLLSGIENRLRVLEQLLVAMPRQRYQEELK